MENKTHIPLVTGATGFIGGHLAERLVREGHNVRLLVRNAGKLAPALRGADIVTGDLCDKAALEKAVSGVDVIYHCAANVITWDRPEHYKTANVNGVENLLNVVARANPNIERFVHVSSVDVYDFPATPRDEACALHPCVFGYGESKRQGEAVVRKICAAHNIPYTILRPANVIGPKSQFIARIGKELKSGLMLKINGGRVNAGFIYVDHLVDYLLWAASSEKAAGETYNARDDYDVTWAEFIAAFRRAIKGRGLVVSLPFAVADIAAFFCALPHKIFRLRGEPLLHRLIVRIFGRTCGHSAEKIRADSGFAGKTSFDAVLERSVNWFLEQT